ncbi:hypothetical protein ACP4OV_024000 [Aristida adscensionis]
MEFEWGGRRRRDDASEGRHRSPGAQPPPPPLHGDAAAARGREELLRELDKSRVHQDMILRELIETERAVASRPAPAPAGRWPAPRTQEYWHSRPLSSVPPREEGEVSPLRLMQAVAEHPPSGSWSPLVRPPPVYLCVELSPSPVPWRRPADGIAQQQERLSSGVRAQPFDGYVELCRSPKKRAPAEEALVPAAAYADVKRARSASFGDKVAAEHQRADVRRDRMADGEERYGLQSLFDRSQDSGQRRIAESAREGRMINEPVQPSCHYNPAGKENASFDEQKRLQFTEECCKKLVMFTSDHNRSQWTLPKVHISLSIPEHQCPANETKQQQESSSYGEIAQPMSGPVELGQQESSSYGEIAQPLSGYVELGPSPSKWTLMRENLVPAASNANIGPMQQKAEESAMKG